MANPLDQPVFNPQAPLVTEGRYPTDYVTLMLQWLITQASRALRGGTILADDPAVPTNNTWWIVAEPGTPLTTIALKVQIYDTTYSLASIDVPTP